MQPTHPAVIAVWDASASRYVQAPGGVCVGAGDSPGTLCGAEVFRRIGGVGLCAEHYDRMMYDRSAIFRQEDEDCGWSFEARQWDADAREVVYYLLRESDGLIKIGTSARFRTRFGELCTEHGALRILATHRGDRDCETGMHRRFKKMCVHGEWFRPGKPLLEWIMEIRRQQAKIIPSGLAPGTVALSDVIPLAVATRRRHMRVARMRVLP